MHHRFALLVIATLGSACTVQAPEAEEPVDTAESALLPLLPICIGPTAMPQTAQSPGGFTESVDLWGPGDRSDFAWSESRLSAPSSLYKRVSVTSTVNMSEARIEINMTPFTGYVAAGVNVTLEVRDGSRVLCSATSKLVERSTVAGEIDDGFRGVRTLTCGFDSTGLTSAPVARTTLETWATVAGLGTAFVRASGSARIEETKCMSLLISP